MSTESEFSAISEAFIEELRKAGVKISSKTETRVNKKMLKKFFKPEKPENYMTTFGMNMEDIKDEAKEFYRIKLSKKEALKALKYMDKRYENHLSQETLVELAIKEIQDQRAEKKANKIVKK